MATIILRPNGVGDYTNIQGTYPQSVPHWQYTGDNNDSTWVYSTSSGEVKDDYTLQDPTWDPAQVASVDSVGVYFRIEAMTGGRYAKPYLRLNGNETAGTAVQCPGSLITYSQTLTRPGGGSWTKDDITNLHQGIGLSGASVSYYAYCSDVWIVVTYTPVTSPILTTEAASNIGLSSATGNGTITSVNGANATRRGFCYKVGVSGDPTIADSIVYEDGSFGIGSYSLPISGLSAGTAYRVRAYATNLGGTGYGNTVQMATLAAAFPVIGGGHVITVIGEG